jgi:dATP/dGTP diphosphohydrolase
MDAATRKEYPVGTGFLDYFPDAVLEVAHVSFVGNQQHNPGEPLRWAREKSTDEPDAMIRHFLERGKLDGDGVRHSAKMAWRALAILQKEIEAEVPAKRVEWEGKPSTIKRDNTTLYLHVCGCEDHDPFLCETHGRITR